jgi:hypothetical protein
MTDTTTPAAAPAAAPAPAASAAPAAAPAAPASSPESKGSVLEAALGAEEAKAPATEGEKPAAPGIELKLPEGYKVDDAAMAAFKEAAGKLGLDSAKAQSVFDATMALEQSRIKADEAAFAKQNAEWRKAIESDPEVGGAKLAEASIDVQRALKKFGGKDMVELLSSAGLGNHPVFFKTFAAIGRALKEDTVAGTAKAPAAPKKSDAELFGFTT